MGIVCMNTHEKVRWEIWATISEWAGSASDRVADLWLYKSLTFTIVFTLVNKSYNVVEFEHPDPTCP